MKTIKAVLIGDVYDYAEPVPADAVAIRFDGTTNTFTVYQPGDDIPPPPGSEAE